MPGYLEGYGAGEEKREKLIKRIALFVVLALIVGGVSYFFLRNFRETQQTKLFFELLRKQDYVAAYRLWGCTRTPLAPATTWIGSWRTGDRRASTRTCPR